MEFLWKWSMKTILYCKYFKELIVLNSLRMNITCMCCFFSIILLEYTESFLEKGEHTTLYYITVRYFMSTILNVLFREG